MLVEVSIAVNYILSHLYTKLPRRRVDSFGEELERYLHAKYQQHWFPQDPMRDAAYRCLNVGGPQVDLLLPEAAAVSGLDWSEIQACLPEGLVLSVDPGHVACQYHQPQFTTQEFNRYTGTPFWPSASVSLSSSGCSSASSSISSTNLTPTSNQVTHQVLYCFQDSWFANNGNQWNEGVSACSGQNKVHRTDTEHGDNLATAAALSVLVDAEDNFNSNLGSDLFQKPNDLLPFNTNGINTSAPSLENNDLVHLLFRDADLNGSSSNGSDNRISTGNLPWSTTETADNETSLITMMNGDLNPGLTPASQIATYAEKSRTTLPVLNRSSSNPPQTEQPSLPVFNDYTAISSTNLNTNANALGPITNKFDLSGNPVFTANVQPRLNAIYGQPSLSQLANPSSNSHFVQKSVSTPSFTAATFAQTKFGSTKLKTQSKRTPNRILSPTTVPQTFAAYNGSNLIGRDSINVTAMGTNHQRMSHGTGLELNSIERLLPAAMGQNGKPVSPGVVELPGAFDRVDSRPVVGMAPSSVNAVQKKLFPFAGVPPSGNESIQPNLLFDGLFPSNVEETRHPDDPFGNLNFSEALNHSAPNPNKIWPNPSTMPFYRTDNSNCPVSNLLTGSDWLQSSQPFSAAEMLSTQPGKPTTPRAVYNNNNNNNNTNNNTVTVDSQLAGKSEYAIDFSDDALLSTRMVSLLLEEDTTADPIKDSLATASAPAAPTGLEMNTADGALSLINAGQSVSMLDNIPNELGVLKNASNTE